MTIMCVNSRQGEIMSFDTSITESIQSQTAKRVELVSDGTSSQVQTAYEVESQLWQSLLVMGQHLMQLFFNISVSVFAMR